jgi:DNA-binding CsgD family transcriptional regulator/tetratricopeptide (TPR) repeat protein
MAKLPAEPSRRVRMIEIMSARLVSPILVGRQAELRAIERGLDAALLGMPVHLLIAGEAGVGKSRLINEATRAARARGMRVVRGACPNIGDGGVPYGPIVEALRGLIRDTDATELSLAVGSAGADLTRLVPTFAPEDRSKAPKVQDNWLQARLLEALLGLFQRLAATAPQLFVVEDLHWADPATRETIAFLIRNLQSERVMVALTFRSDELHRRHPLLPWLAELERGGLVERIDLERLTPQETRDQLTAIIGTEPTRELADQIHRRSDGNPFFVEELLVADREGGRPHRLPPTLREILLARLAAVPESAQAVIGVAAVAGRRVDHDLLSAVAGLTDTSLDASLRAAVGSQVLVTDPGHGAQDGYEFRHALLQEAAYDDLLPGERRRLHRGFAQALSMRPAGDGAVAAAHWAELAFHWSAARDDVQAFDASARAAEAAEQAYAFADAHRHYERVLELWATAAGVDGSPNLDRAAVLSRAAQAAFFGGDARRSVTLSREAVAALDPVVDPVGAAVLRERLGRALWNYGDSEGALAASEEAVALIPSNPPTAERARVLSGLGQMLMLLDHWSESRRICEEAIELSRRVGALQPEGHAMNTLGLDLVAEGRCGEGIEALRQALAIATDLGNVDDIGRAYVNLGDALFFSGEGEQALDVVDEGIRVAEGLGIARSYGGVIRQNGVLYSFDLGRWEQASRLATESFAIQLFSPNNERYGLARWVGLLVATGGEAAATRLDQLGELLEGVPVESQFTGPYHAARAELASWQDRPGDALGFVQDGLAEISHSDWYWYHIRLIRHGAWAAADLAEKARARRDAAAEREAIEAGQSLGHALEPMLTVTLARQSGPDAEETRAEAATIAAEITRMHGVPSLDAWREAVARWTARRRPYLEAYCRWREGEASLVTGDRPGAATALSRAHEIASDLSARPLQTAIESLAARARITLATEANVAAARARSSDASPEPSPGPTPPADPFGLTRREREVFALLSVGRTNRQIAAELFISESTAGVHVSNILGKLGVATRTEAAGIAARLGFGPA